MQISKSDFHRYLSEYTEDELFYKKIYLLKKEHPETFSEYLRSLDQDYIRSRRLFVPELRQEPWFPYMGENDLFENIPENIIISKHYRYTPEFTHKHDFFEILCVYEGTVSNQIQGIHHTLHSGDICIIPPNTQHSLGIFDDSLQYHRPVIHFPEHLLSVTCRRQCSCEVFFPCSLPENRRKFPNFSYR